MTPDRFLELWSNWKFPFCGKPEDAALYIGEALEWFKEQSPEDQFEVLGGADGQYYFIAFAFVAMGLLEQSNQVRFKITTLGEEYLLAMKMSVYLTALVPEDFNCA